MTIFQKVMIAIVTAVAIIGSGLIIGYVLIYKSAESKVVINARVDTSPQYRMDSVLDELMQRMDTSAISSVLEAKVREVRARGVPEQDISKVVQKELKAEIDNWEQRKYAEIRARR